MPLDFWKKSKESEQTVQLASGIDLLFQFAVYLHHTEVPQTKPVQTCSVDPT